VVPVQDNKNRLGPLISTAIYAGCIHCTRCVPAFRPGRFRLNPAVGTNPAAAEHMEGGNYLEQSVDHEFVGVTSQSTGALVGAPHKTKHPFRYHARSPGDAAQALCRRHRCRRHESSMRIRCAAGSCRIGAAGKKRRPSTRPGIADRDGFPASEGRREHPYLGPERVTHPADNGSNGAPPRAVDWTLARPRGRKGARNDFGNSNGSRVRRFLSSPAPPRSIICTVLARKLHRGLGSGNIDSPPAPKLDFSSAWEKDRRAAYS